MDNLQWTVLPAKAFAVFQWSPHQPENDPPQSLNVVVTTLV